MWGHGNMKKRVMVGALAVSLTVFGMALAVDMNGPQGPGGGGVLADLGTNPPIDPPCTCKELSITTVPQSAEVCEKCCLPGVVKWVLTPGTDSYTVKVSIIPGTLAQVGKTSCEDNMSSECEWNYSPCSSGQENFYVKGVNAGVGHIKAVLYKNGIECLQQMKPLTVVRVDSVTPAWTAVSTNVEVTFTATTTPAHHGDNVYWSGGGVPATGHGETFTTKWANAGCKTVVAMCDGGCNQKEAQVAVVNLDLDIDSDHTSDFGGPQGDAFEDSIEWQFPGPHPHEAHKYVVVNDYCRESEQGKPGYADFAMTVPDGPVPNGIIIPLSLKCECPTDCGLDFSQATIKFEYSSSEPSGVTASSDHGETIWPIPSGNLRLWKKQGSRNPAHYTGTGSAGDYLAANQEIAASSLGFPGSMSLYLESINPSASLGADSIKATVKIPATAGGVYSFEDLIHCTAIKVDVDTDTDNNNGYEAPDRNLKEDHYEDMPGTINRPGKILAVNDNDDDQDGIPDFADGYNRYGNISADDINVSEKFVPVIFEIPEPIKLERAKVKLTYEASDPMGVATNAQGVYQLPGGSLRLWTKKGNVARKGTSILDSLNPGDYIPAGECTAEEFGFTGGTRTLTYYVEAVQASTALADKRILFEVDPDERTPPNFIAADAVKLTVIKVELDGLRVYDPKLENAGNAEIKYRIEGPASGFAPRLELTVMDGSTEVACIVRKTDASPVIGTDITKNWDGKWGVKKDGSDTPHKGKLADPKQYKMELRVYESVTATTDICIKEYSLYVVRLGTVEMGFLDDQEVTYHKKTKDDTDNYQFTDNSGFANDVVWKMEHIDFLKPAGPVSRTETRKEQTPTGESYADTDNAAGRTGTEQYFDEDGDGGYTAGLRQANFPPQTPTANKDVSAGIENTRYNRPAVCVRNSPVKIWFKFGTQAKSDLTLADCAVGYPTAEHPIWVVGKFGGADMGRDSTDPATDGDAIRNINPAGGPYKLKSTATLANTVGYDVETIEFTFKYNKKGEGYVDANGNGSYDTGETIINDNGNGTYDEELQDIPGKQTTTHLIYRLADAPKATAKTASGRLWLKIVDFTCNWANGLGTPAQVFDKIWNTDNFWTPIVAGPQPDNANGFHGVNDPVEATRLDMWGNAPKCYSYQHNMGAGNGFTVDWVLDFNQGRCGAFAPFLMAFMGTHGLDTAEQVFPAMKWRFVSNAGVVSFEKDADAITHIANGQRPGGGAAQAGDVWYRPRGILVSAHGQANPFYANSDYLVSFWRTDPANHYTDHVFVKYNGRYYDGSYEHAGGASYATINEKADAGVSDYYYDGKWAFDAGAGVFQNTTATMPLDRIWMGPYGWLWGWERILKVANNPAMDEMEEP